MTGNVQGSGVAGYSFVVHTTASSLTGHIILSSNLIMSNFFPALPLYIVYVLLALSIRSKGLVSVRRVSGGLGPTPHY